MNKTGEPPSVQKEEGLPSSGEVLTEGLPEFVREDGAFFLLLPHVDNLDRGQGPPLNALVQFQEPKLLRHRIVIRLQGGRGRSEYQHRFTEFSPDRGQVPGIISQLFLLFVGGFVLLVDDDHPQALEGGEDGRTSPYNDIHLSLSDPPPLIIPLTPGEPAVKRGYPPTEPLEKLPDELRGQGDLGNQNDGLSPPLKHPFNGPQVNLRLTASRNPEKEVG